MIFVNDFVVSFLKVAIVPASGERQCDEYKTRKEKRENGGLMRSIVHLRLPHGAGPPLLDVFALALLLGNTGSKELSVISLWQASRDVSKL